MAVLLAVLGLAGAACQDESSGRATTGPVTVHLEATEAATPADLDAAATVVRSRLHAADIEGEARAVDGGVDLRLISAADRDQVAKLVESPGEVGFHPVLEISDRRVRAGEGEEVVETGSGDAREWYRLAPAVFGGEVLESVSATASMSSKRRWELHPVLRAGSAGIDQLNEVAEHCVASDATCPTGRLAILLDDRVLSAPTIAASGFERDQIVISGTFSERDARVLAAILAGGALRLELREVVPR